jgi:hypothetical protein
MARSGACAERFIMSDQGASGKICTNCHLDCSTRPRVKDRAGRYICRDCLKQMKATGQTLAPPRAARHAAAATAGSDQDVMAALVDDAITRQPAACPHCGVPGKAGMILCVHCGYNSATGRTVHTRVTKEKAPKEERRVGGGGGSDVGAIAAGVSFLVLGGVFALAFTNPDAAVGYLVLQSLFGLVVSILVLVFAFMEDAMTGFLTLCVPFYILYFVYGKCENAYVKSLFSISLIASVGSGYLQANMMVPL